MEKGIDTLRIVYRSRSMKKEYLNEHNGGQLENIEIDELSSNDTKTLNPTNNWYCCCPWLRFSLTDELRDGSGITEHR